MLIIYFYPHLAIVVKQNAAREKVNQLRTILLGRGYCTAAAMVAAIASKPCDAASDAAVCDQRSVAAASAPRASKTRTASDEPWHDAIISGVRLS